MKKSNDPSAKYTSSYETLLKATYLYTGSTSEVEKMYKYFVFNCLIGNGEAHLKNFALQYSPDLQNILFHHHLILHIHLSTNLLIIKWL